MALIFAMGLLSGYSVLQYADVRASYPRDDRPRTVAVHHGHVPGRGLVQWFTGWVAAWAEAWGVEPYKAVMISIAATLVGASTAFRFLPSSPLLRQVSAA